MAHRRSGPNKSWLFLVMIWLAVASNHAFTQPLLKHNPPQQARMGSPIIIDCTLRTGPDLHVQKAHIFFRSGAETTYRSVTMQSIGDNWQGIIPAKLVRDKNFKYFITFLFDNQTLKTFPEKNPYNQPHALELLPPAAAVTIAPPAVAVPQKSSPSAPTASMPTPVPSVSSAVTTSDTLQLLSPEPDGTYDAQDVLLAVSYMGETELDPLRVRIDLDIRDVTRQAEITGNLITLTPAELIPGRHIIKVQAHDVKNRLIPPVSVRFFIIGQEKSVTQAPEKMRAHVYTDLMYEETGDKGNRVAMAGAELSGKWKSFAYRGNLFFTSLEDRHFQPRNRFSFSISNKWIGVAGGDVYPRYNELILAGKRVRGVNGYLHLGLVNLDVVYGQTQRSVKTAWTRIPGGTDADSLQVNRYGTFSQTLIGVRPSLGDGRHFQLGLTLVKIKDDTGSVAAGLLPKDNLIIGPDVKLSLLRDRIVLTAQAAVSAITQDIYPGAVTSDDVERAFGDDFELPLDPQTLDNLLIINDSTIPLNPLDGGSLAYLVNLRVNLLQQFLNVGYRSIGSEYISLANPWLRKDLRGFFINDRLRFLSNRVYLTLGYEQYADNFSEQNANPAIDLRTLNYALTLLPGENYPQLNISLRDQLRDNHVDTISVQSYQISSLLDSTTVVRDEREKIWFRDLAIQASQNFRLFDISHQMNLGYISSRNIDDFEDERGAGHVSAELSNRIVMLSLTTRYAVPLTTTFSYSHNVMDGSGIPDLNYQTMAFSGEYRFLQDRLATFADCQYTHIRQQSAASADIEQNRMQLRLGTRWQFSPGQSLVLEGQLWRYTMNLDEVSSTANATDSILRLRFDRYF